VHVAEIIDDLKAARERLEGYGAGWFHIIEDQEWHAGVTLSSAVLVYGEPDSHRDASFELDRLYRLANALREYMSELRAELRPEIPPSYVEGG
jgi:hypothetical protein